MNSLYSKLTNLFDQDFMSLEDGKPIFDWLYRHQEDINNIEIDYLNDILNVLKKVAKLEHRLSNCIEPKFKQGTEIYYVAPKRQIVKATVIGYFDKGLIVKCKNRNFIQILNNNAFTTEQEANVVIEKYYNDIPKNYKRNKLNNVYSRIKQRCYNKNSESYINYGGRGITMCDEWKNSYYEFKKWAESNGYQEDILLNGRNRLTLDRIDNDKGYCPENCRWITQKEQQNNRRNNRKAKLEEVKK